MGQSSEALEREVSAIREITAVAAKQDREQAQREKLAVDRHFAALLQLRGELQRLRHRVRLDQRDSDKSAGARTISIEQQSADGAGDAFMIVDEVALIRTESGASRILALRCATALLDNWECANAMAANRAMA
jgi:hypothetical protein